MPPAAHRARRHGRLRPRRPRSNRRARCLHRRADPRARRTRRHLPTVTASGALRAAFARFADEETRLRGSLRVVVARPREVVSLKSSKARTVILPRRRRGDVFARSRNHPRGIWRLFPHMISPEFFPEATSYSLQPEFLSKPVNLIENTTSRVSVCLCDARKRPRRGAAPHSRAAPTSGACGRDGAARDGRCGVDGGARGAAPAAGGGAAAGVHRQRHGIRRRLVAHHQRAVQRGACARTRRRPCRDHPGDPAADVPSSARACVTRPMRASSLSFRSRAPVGRHRDRRAARGRSASGERGKMTALGARPALATPFPDALPPGRRRRTA